MELGYPRHITTKGTEAIALGSPTRGSRGVYTSWRGYQRILKPAETDGSIYDAHAEIIALAIAESKGGSVPLRSSLVDRIHVLRNSDP